MSEKKLIDKEKLEMYLNDWMLNISGDGYENMSKRKRARYDTLEQVFDAVSHFPTIAPETLRPVANWVKGEDFMSEYYACSRCAHKVRDRFGTSAYCPRCGAKMEGNA